MKAILISQNKAKKGLGLLVWVKLIDRQRQTDRQTDRQDPLEALKSLPSCLSPAHRQVYRWMRWIDR